MNIYYQLNINNWQLLFVFRLRAPNTGLMYSCLYNMVDCYVELIWILYIDWTCISAVITHNYTNLHYIILIGFQFPAMLLY